MSSKQRIRKKDFLKSVFFDSVSILEYLLYCFIFISLHRSVLFYGSLPESPCDGIFKKKYVRYLVYLLGLKSFYEILSVANQTQTLQGKVWTLALRLRSSLLGRRKNNGHCTKVKGMHHNQAITLEWMGTSHWCILNNYCLVQMFPLSKVLEIVSVDVVFWCCPQAVS